MRVKLFLLSCAIAALPVAASAQTSSTPLPPEPIFEPLPGPPILVSSQVQLPEKKYWAPAPEPRAHQQAPSFAARIAQPVRIAAPVVRPVRRPAVPVTTALVTVAPAAAFEVAPAALVTPEPAAQIATAAPPKALAPPLVASVAPKAVALASPAPVAPLQQAFILPGNTSIQLRLDSSVSSDFSRVGDNVRLMVVRDVTIDGRIVIPRGMSVLGEVVQSGGRGGFGKGGRVEIAARSLTLNGKVVALDGTLKNKGKGASAGKMLLFGGLVGLVGMSQVRGRDAIIGPEQTLMATTRADVSINVQVAALALSE
jgi:hypothetical protein